jgi:hypothetical protein
MFTKGIPKIGGRKAGTPNKLTATFREAVLFTYDGIGGHEAFKRWATDNPGEFYKIAARLIPTEMSVKDDKIVVIVNRGGNNGVTVVEQRQALEDHSIDDSKVWRPS